jgi:hypothetical protein
MQIIISYIISLVVFLIITYLPLQWLFKFSK